MHSLKVGRWQQHMAPAASEAKRGYRRHRSACRLPAATPEQAEEDRRWVNANQTFLARQEGIMKNVSCVGGWVGELVCSIPCRALTGSALRCVPRSLVSGTKLLRNRRRQQLQARLAAP